MNADGILDIAAKIVTVALVTTVLIRGTAAAKLVQAVSGGFADSLRAAQGR